MINFVCTSTWGKKQMSIHWINLPSIYDISKQNALFDLRNWNINMNLLFLTKTIKILLHINFLMCSKILKINVKFVKINVTVFLSSIRGIISWNKFYFKVLTKKQVKYNNNKNSNEQIFTTFALWNYHIYPHMPRL